MQGKQKIAQVFAKDSFYGLCKKGDKTGYDISFEIKNLKAPLSCGQVVGKLFVSQNGKLIKEIDLVIKDSIEKLGFIDNIKQIASNW